MSEVNEKTIAEEVRQSMIRAGIGSAYHARQLPDVPHGADFKAAMLDGTVAGDIEVGKGWTVFGGSAEAYDLFVLMARAMLLTSVGAKLTTPDKIINAFEDRWEDEIERLHQAPVLFIARFVQKTECPYSRWQRKRVETLIEDRLDRRRPTYIQMADIMKAWWSEELVDRLYKNHRLIEAEGTN